VKLISLYKNAYSGLPKNIWLLSWVMLINRSGTMVVAFLTLYCTQHLKLTEKYAGIAVAAYGFGAILGALIGGRLSDKVGYKKVQIVSLIGGGLFFIATSFAQNFYWFCFFIFCLACVNESFRPANTSAIAANSDSKNRTRSFALLRLAMNLGWSIGTTIGGFLSHYNYQLLFWVDGVTSICAGIAMLFLQFKPLVKESTINELVVTKDISPYKNKPFLYFIFGTLLYTFCFFQLFSNLPLFYKIGLGLDETIIGVVMAMNGIVIVLVEMMLVNKLEKKYSKKRVIIIGTIGMALFFLVSSGMHILNVYLLAFGGMLLITLAEMLSLPFMNSYYLGYAGKHNTGKYAAVYTMCWSIGQILAGYIGGSFIYAYGFIPLWFSCTILSLICAYIYYRVIK
jgi:MFS family permease